MARRNNNSETSQPAVDQQAPQPTAQDATLPADQVIEPLEEVPGDQKVAGKTCPTCEGRGIRPEISEHELCPDCGGSGTL